MTVVLLVALAKTVAALGIVFAVLNLWELARTGRCEMKDWL